MRLYHVTTAVAAQSILREGFRERECVCGTGVWLTDDPLAIRSSSSIWVGNGCPDAFIEVQLDVELDALDDLEVINEGKEGPPAVGQNYREWLIREAWLNEHATLSIIGEPDSDELYERLRRERKPIPPLPPEE